MAAVWTGLTLGAIYGLTALGYNLVYLTAGVFNFAQAQLVMVGAFAAYWTSAQLGLPVVTGFAIGGAIGFALAALVYRIAIRPLGGESAYGVFVSTVGVAVALAGAVELIWGDQPLAVPFFGGSSPVELASLRVLPVQLALIAAGLLIPLAIGAFMRFTLMGLATAAASEDADSARLRGVDVPRVSFLAVALAGALAGCLGPLVAPQTFAVFTLGDVLAVQAFVVMAIGGFGSTLGAAVGGFAIGLVQALGTRYLNVDWGNVLVFGVLLAVLLVKPTGLFGAQRQRLV